MRTKKRWRQRSHRMRMRNNVTKMTDKWICECSCNNPLHNKECRCCRRPMPQSIIDNVYKEELKIQLYHIKKENLETSQRRVNKLETLMQKFNKAIIPIVIGIVVMMTACIFFLGNTNAHYVLINYKYSRITRYRENAENISKSFSNIRNLPSSGGDFTKTIAQNFQDVWNGLKEISQDVPEKINIEKIDNIINRFRGK